MRILNSVTDARIGGPQLSSIQVSKKIRQRELETVFLIPGGNDDFADLARSEGFETVRTSPHQIRPPIDIVGNAKFLRSFVPMVAKIRKIIDEHDIDIVHAKMSHNYHTALAAARSDTPLVWHFNDVSKPSPIKQISSFAARRWADEIAVASNAVSTYYGLDQSEVKTIYSPVDLGTFDPNSRTVDNQELRKDIGVESDAPLVGAIGNINPIKGHEYLLRAADQVDCNMKLAILIIGKKLDTQQSYFKRLIDLRAELGLEGTVKFLGYRSEVPDLLSLFDVFVLPSIAEACPMVVLEAMAMETPVIATNVGGIPEQVPDSNHGWLVPSKDPNALSDAIFEALSDPRERKKRAKNARERVESIFSLESIAKDYESLYYRLGKT